MARSGMPALLVALVLFIALFSNVAIGAAGGGVFLGDLGEMLTLLGASIFFVVGVLMKERSAREAAARDD